MSKNEVKDKIIKNTRGTRARMPLKLSGKGPLLWYKKWGFQLKYERRDLNFSSVHRDLPPCVSQQKRIERSKDLLIVDYNLKYGPWLITNMSQFVEYRDIELDG